MLAGTGGGITAAGKTGGGSLIAGGGVAAGGYATVTIAKLVQRCEDTFENKLSEWFKENYPYLKDFSYSQHAAKSSPGR